MYDEETWTSRVVEVKDETILFADEKSFTSRLTGRQEKESWLKRAYIDTEGSEPVVGETYIVRYKGEQVSTATFLGKEQERKWQVQQLYNVHHVPC